LEKSGKKDNILLNRPWGCKMDEKELKNRTKRFALDIIKLVEKLPAKMVAQTIGRQLVRAGTSVGANHRSACRGRSRAEFAAKLGIVEEEADESAFWMEIIIEAGMMERRLVQPLLDEAEELVAIMVASRKSVNLKSAI
jgi:four helix bundle protein